MEADDLVLAEIDENLARGDLSPAERAIHVQRRKEIYERVNGPAKAVGGRARAEKAGESVASAKSALASFTTDTAQKTGQSKRKIQLDAQRATKITNISDVVGTSLDKGHELDALAMLPPERQEKVIAKAKAGERVSAKVEARKDRRAEIEQSGALTGQTRPSHFKLAPQNWQ